MDIIENQDAWIAEFESNWLKHYNETGETNWKLYNIPRNKEIPAGKGINLSESRLVLISSAGLYHKETQEPYDAENDLGDYTIRLFSADTPWEELAIAHTHYDHTDVNKDPQVLLPIAHLKDLVNEGVIGELASEVVSFMGYQPDASSVANETVPAVIEAVKAIKADGALLVPS